MEAHSDRSRNSLLWYLPPPHPAPQSVTNPPPERDPPPQERETPLLPPEPSLLLPSAPLLW
jgi:hypothetical protein